MATVSGALGQGGPEGAEEGRVSAPASQPYSGTRSSQDAVSAQRSWPQSLADPGRSRSLWGMVGLPFSDFFSFLAPFLGHVLRSPALLEGGSASGELLSYL